MSGSWTGAIIVGFIGGSDQCAHIWDTSPVIAGFSLVLALLGAIFVAGIIAKLQN